MPARTPPMEEQPLGKILEIHQEIPAASTSSSSDRRSGSEGGRDTMSTRPSRCSRTRANQEDSCRHHRRQSGSRMGGAAHSALRSLSDDFEITRCPPRDANARASSSGACRSTIARAREQPGRGRRRGHRESAVPPRVGDGGAQAVRPCIASGRSASAEERRRWPRWRRRWSPRRGRPAGPPAVAYVRDLVGKAMSERCSPPR